MYKRQNVHCIFHETISQQYILCSFFFLLVVGHKAFLCDQKNEKVGRIDWIFNRYCHLLLLRCSISFALPLAHPGYPYTLFSQSTVSYVYLKPVADSRILTKVLVGWHPKIAPGGLEAVWRNNCSLCVVTFTL